MTSLHASVRISSVVVACGLMAGCLLDGKVGYRPTRLHLGPTARAVNVVPGPDTPAAGGIRRVSAPDGATSRQQVGATSVAMQLTILTPRWFYSGVEVESGRLEAPGSKLAGAYGIAGVDQRIGAFSFGAEVAAGWQRVRHAAGEDDVSKLVAEPRVRGLLWIAEQWTLGATLGARMGQEGGAGEWMGGVYLGIHSQRF